MIAFLTYWLIASVLLAPIIGRGLKAMRMRAEREERDREARTERPGDSLIHHGAVDTAVSEA